MSLEHAVLGLLNYEPMTGYDLKKMIDLSINHFWPAVQSQIYKTLARMETDNWVSVETIPQEPRPPRKLYRLTPTGQAELMRWLSEPQPAAETRLAWLVQIFFAGQLSDEKVVALLEYQLALQRARVGRYASIPPENREAMSEDNPRDRFFWMLTVDFGVAQALAQVRWLETTLERVKNKDYRLPTLEADKAG